MWRRFRLGTVAVVLALNLLAPWDPAVAYPIPGELPPVSAATLTERYLANRQAVREAVAVARAAGARQRASTLESLVGRQLLEFDPRGTGRAVEVVGDLITADRVAVLVPGAHTTLDTFDRRGGPGGGARALIGETATRSRGVRVAAVAWLGYRPPQGFGPGNVTDWLARTGADALRTTVAQVRAVNPHAPVILLCHSYGSVVCGLAAPGLPVSDLVFYGSPGVGVADVSELRTGARVWAGRSAGDWIRFVPPVRLAGLGFGTDPVSPGFGARVFDAGDGGHGDYHQPGGAALASLARVVLGATAPPGDEVGPLDGAEQDRAVAATNPDRGAAARGPIAVGSAPGTGHG